MIDPSDRIVRINEVLAALNEQPEIPPSLPPGPKPTAEQEAERDARIAEARKRADEEQQAKFKKERDDVEAARKFNPNATRFYPDVTMKGKERREALRGYMDYLRMDPERLRLFKQQKAYASAEMVGQAQRARTAYDRSAANTAERLAAYNRGAALSRAGSIGRHSPGLVPGLADAANATYDADMSSLALADLIKKQKSEGQIRAQNLKDRQGLEAEIRNKPDREMTPDEENELNARMLTKGTGDMESRRAGQLGKQSSATSPAQMGSQRAGQLGKQSSATSPAQTDYEFYNRNTGQIERSDAPGVDRVFRDSSGKPYRIEGGSGRKIYV